MVIPIMPYLMDDGLNTVDIKRYHLAEIKSRIQSRYYLSQTLFPKKNRQTTQLSIQSRIDLPRAVPSDWWTWASALVFANSWGLAHDHPPEKKGNNLAIWTYPMWKTTVFWTQCGMYQQMLYQHTQIHWIPQIVVSASRGVCLYQLQATL
jgi:hypothetical protein